MLLKIQKLFSSKSKPVPLSQGKSINAPHLQYVSPGTAGTCELVIGLDFGTSSSKVVIQAPDLQGHPAFAVDFGQFAYETIPYLLPTNVRIMPNGKCTLTESDGAKACSDLKVQMLSNDDFIDLKDVEITQDVESTATVVCYIALLLRYTRKWFMDTNYNLISHFEEIIWSINMGVPSPSIEDNAANKTFTQVGKASWTLSTVPDDNITIQRATRELPKVVSSQYWEEENPYACDFALIPEIAAGAVGYAMSEQRRRGLHILIDIGAATFDVCVFRLGSAQGNNRYDLITTDVKPFGTLMLHTALSSSIIYAGDKHKQSLLKEFDYITPVETNIDHYTISNSEQKKIIKEVTQQFKRQFIITIKRVLLYTRQIRRPNDDAWERESRLPILLIGGGSASEFYKSAVSEINSWLKLHKFNDGTIPMDATMPDDVAHGFAEYLTVAWGLSHRDLDISKITPADLIPDLPLIPSMNPNDFFVSKDQV